MKKKIHKHNKEIAGFTLIELTLVIAILSLMLSASIYVLRSQADYFDVTITQTKLNAVSSALQVYNEKHGSYPCPAPLNAATGTDGIAATSCTDCSGGYGPNPYYCAASSNVVIGAIPFNTLGLSRQASLDVWNKKLIYAIDKRHTTGSCQSKGQIQIIDKNGFQINNASIYAVVSTGFDGKGSYDSNGILTAACNSAALDGENCSFTLSQANFNNIFRTTNIAKDNVTAGVYFDDILAWQINPNLTYCPAQVGDCILWLDGADICTITLDASNKVTFWLDKSRSNLTATPASSSNPPDFTNTDTSLLNKNTYLTFTSASSHLLSVNGTFALPQTNFTKIIVFRTSSSAIAAITAAAQGGSYTSTADRQFGTLASGQFAFVMQGGGRINSSGTYTNGKTHVASVTVDSITGERMFIDGIQIASAIQTTSTLTTNSFLIGGSSAWGYYNGDIMEVLVYNHALSNIERKTAETYLATKWGIPY